MLLVRRLPSEGGDLRVCWEGHHTQPDQAQQVPPCPSLLLGPAGSNPSFSFFKDFTGIGHWSFVEEKHKREKREQVLSQPRVFGEVASSAVF